MAVKDEIDRLVDLYRKELIDNIRACTVCRKQFLGTDKRKNQCSAKCAAEAQMIWKREWWRIHGKQWRRNL